MQRKSVADLLRPDSHGSDGLFLRILKAEKEGLLTYTISPPMRQKIEVINPHEGWGGLARAQHGQQESWEPDLPTLLAAITERYQPLSKGRAGRAASDLDGIQLAIHYHVGHHHPSPWRAGVHSLVISS